MPSPALKQALLALDGGDALVSGLEACDLNNDELLALQQLLLVADQCGCLSTLEDDVIANQISEYEGEAARLQQCLDIIGIQQEQLSNPALQALQQLAAAGSALNLMQVTEPTLTAAWSDLVCQEMQAYRVQERIAEQVSNLQASSACVASSRDDAEDILQVLSRELDTKDKEVNSERPSGSCHRGRLSEFASRSERYKSAIHKMQQVMSAFGLTDELRHHTLVKQSEDNEAHTAELAEVTEKLQVYRDLPPSKLGAEVKLRQVSEQLEGVRARIQQGMANLN